MFIKITIKGINLGGVTGVDLVKPGGSQLLGSVGPKVELSNDFKVIDDSTVTVSLSFPSNITPGKKEFTLKPLSSSSPHFFIDILPSPSLPTPVITSMVTSPTVIYPGQGTINITLKGSNFTGSDFSFIDPSLKPVKVNAAKVADYAFKVIDDSTVTFSVMVDSDAVPGEKYFSIRNAKAPKGSPDAASSIEIFPLPVPTVTSLTTDKIAYQGQAGVGVTVLGTHLTDAVVSYANTADSVLQILNQKVVSDTTMLFTVNVPAGTIAGLKSLTFTTPYGSVSSSAFEVKMAPTTAIKIDPPEATQGEKDKSITITGKNLTGSVLTSENTGIVVKGSTFASNGGFIILKIDLSDTVAIGGTNFIVTPKSGAPIKLPFTVKAKVSVAVPSTSPPKISSPVSPPPVVTSVSPSPVLTGQNTVTMTIRGSNLTGATITSKDFSVSDVKISDSKTLTFVATVRNLPPGRKFFTLSTPGGSLTNLYILIQAK